MDACCSKNKIIHDLYEIGIEKGDKLFLQSSFKAVGIEGVTPEIFIDAVLEAVGTKGLLAVPAFSYSYSNAMLEGIGKAPAFIGKQTECFTGIIPKTLLKREEACRSNHPSHSIAAVGYGAEQLVEGHGTGSAFGRNTPLHRLATLGGKVLLLGVNHNRSSMIHVAEFIAELPFLHIPYGGSWGNTYDISDYEGNIIEVPIESKLPGCSEAFPTMDEVLRESHMIRDGYIGNAKSMLIKAGDILDAAVPILKKNPGFLLCDNPECESCTERKAFLKENGIFDG